MSVDNERLREKARSRAKTRLVHRHRAEFAALFDEEMERAAFEWQAEGATR